MFQSSSRKSSNLISKCHFLVLYQLGSIVLFISSGILWDRYAIDALIVISMIIIFIWSFVAIYKIYANSTCPKCNKNFFYKGDNPANLGFSFYTHKCTNCGYKIMKDN